VEIGRAGMASGRLLAVRRIVTIALLTLLLAPAAAQTPPATAAAPLVFPEGLPEWAFNIPDPVQPPTPPITGIVRVPGSTREYDAAAIAGNNNPPDWFPEEHPPAPRAVAGPAPNACGSCHLMSGRATRNLPTSRAYPPSTSFGR
jgi:hypothetical protein